MPLRFEDKKNIVEKVNEVAKSSISAVIFSTDKVSVNELTRLRADARKEDVDMLVVRNTLLKRSVEGTDYECLIKFFKGPTTIAFSKEHPGAAARILKDFAKTNPNCEIKALAYEGELIDAKDINKLASLPTLDEARAMLLRTMKEAAAGKLVRTLAALGDKLEQEAN